VVSEQAADVLLADQPARGHRAYEPGVYLIPGYPGVHDRLHSRLYHQVAEALLPVLPESCHAGAYYCNSSHKNYPGFSFCGPRFKRLTKNVRRETDRRLRKSLEKIKSRLNILVIWLSKSPILILNPTVSLTMRSTRSAAS